ncbi:hypothetical protein RI129_012012 [Pyrocoelia pectoralis]|uniref:3'-5' exonuclease domain-containing protein n=1 Tax=Pyrocoelia pectoralis TaxID=417401 RepID=A0AAN7UY45_9COLE
MRPSFIRFVLLVSSVGTNIFTRWLVHMATYYFKIVYCFFIYIYCRTFVFITSFEKMNLRSSAPPIEVSKYKRKVIPDVSSFPFLTYNGKIEYCTDAIDCAFSCDKLLQMANNSLQDFILGFDMEWPFNYNTGSDKTALIQIAPSLNMCHLYHITKFKKLPVVLTELLSHNKVKIVGVNIKKHV